MNCVLANPLPYCGMMCQVMLAGEQEDYGRKGIWPDDFPEWFEPSDWSAWPVLAHDEKELHIIAVASGRKGALRRLIAAAATAGLSPVIVEPMGRAMPAILRKWGWQCSVVGEGWDRREEWRPASVDTLPKGQDAKQGLAGTEGSAVAKPDAQTMLSHTPSPSSRERK